MQHLLSISRAWRCFMQFYSAKSYHGRGIFIKYLTYKALDIFFKLCRNALSILRRYYLEIVMPSLLLQYVVPLLW